MANCTFCNKDEKEVPVLIAAPENRAFICRECVVVCGNVIISHYSGIIEYESWGDSPCDIDGEE